MASDRPWLGFLLGMLVAAGCGGGTGAAEPGAADLALPDLAVLDLAPAAPPVVLLPKEALTAAELGLLINEDDPQSAAAGAYYASARGLPDANVLHLRLGARLPTGVASATFNAWKKQIEAALPAAVQALAVSWTQPSTVDCMSLTTALALGFDRKYCNTSGKGCAPTAPSPYFQSDSTAPYDTDGLRPAMILAGASLGEVKALIDRGVAADGSQPGGTAWMLRTTDAARSVRWPGFEQIVSDWGPHPDALAVRYLDNSAGQAMDALSGQKDILFYLTGLAVVPDIEKNSYRPGAIADHLTSFGGQIPTSGQMSILKWLQAGATASYGTAFEPCNYPAKFPDATVLIPEYFRGRTLIEAYWKSVAWPGEGVFIGEPLARPFPTTSHFDSATRQLTITTSWMVPGSLYAVESAASREGPWSEVLGGIGVEYYQRKVITIAPAQAAYYRLVAR